MSYMIELIYPEKRHVSEFRVLQWAWDAFVNGETDEHVESVADAIRVLEDLGHITVSRNHSQLHSAHGPGVVSN